MQKAEGIQKWRTEEMEYTNLVGQSQVLNTADMTLIESAYS